MPFMGVTLSDISDLARGYHDPIDVGEMPDWLRAKLNVRVPMVHLSAESLRHIRAEHPDLTDFDLLRMSMSIQQGEYYQDGEKPNVILAVHRDEESHRRYVAVMKITNKSCEVWLSSFYRCHPRQIKRWTRKHKRLTRFGK